ncbi:malate synthase A [Paraphotobacterium marinum]|uniref:malate synthase n=1 Tax=Paraphotobacterium marinum TaxID=1755811 RepID=A0A220VDK4_9GAMM|nr:malate synthase A [Paraphotobacterium marinum]ASK78429.1 malate synthase A [Paraphotobacterium marinum]
MNLNLSAKNISADLSHKKIPEKYQYLFSEKYFLFLNAVLEKMVSGHQKLMLQRNSHLENGYDYDFLKETQSIRESNWKINPIPEELLNRQVEITGPVEKKMIINALNSNVKVFMADFEDSFSPTWEKVLAGQHYLREANNRTIDFIDDRGKQYALNEQVAILFCRVRGLHLNEKNIFFKNEVIPGCLLDFTMYFFHNYQILINKKTAPYFYIPKLESHEEAKWWSDVFKFTENYFGLDEGTIKATVLIETLPAVFEMEEILYSLKEHIVALNCGRWDYIFSFIKTQSNDPTKVLPDRKSVTMDKHFLKSYSKLLVNTCHKRGALAMGGMSAFIPSKNPEENKQVMLKIKNDKILEVKNGHDGTWIAHPGLAEVALSTFKTAFSDSPNQIGFMNKSLSISKEDLLTPCSGPKTMNGLIENIFVSLNYLEAWLMGNGCVPINGLMEDVATAEISRASIWQWIKHNQSLDCGQLVTRKLVKEILLEQKLLIIKSIDRVHKFEQASKLLEQLILDDEFVPFLTLSAYELIN